MNRRHALLSATSLAATTALVPPRITWAQETSEPLAAHLDALVAAGQFPGYAAALWHDGAVTAAHGGTLSIGGAPVTADSSSGSPRSPS